MLVVRLVRSIWVLAHLLACVRVEGTQSVGYVGGFGVA